MKAKDVTKKQQLAEHLGQRGPRYDRVYLDDKSTAHWGGTSPLSPAYNELYEKLVPSQGAAETIEGELLRAISKIIYRHYNDGDIFSPSSFDLITQAVGKFNSYDEMADKVVQYVLDKNGQYTPNGGIDWLDSADYGPEDETDDEDEDDTNWEDDEEEMYETGAPVARAKKPLTAKQKMAQVSKEGLISADSIRGKGPNTYIFRRGYYYRHGMDAKQFADRVSEELTKLGIAHKLVDCGDKWAAFKGGASLASQSHFWAVFTVSDEGIAEAKLTDPDLIRARNKANTDYPNYDKDTAMLKHLQKGVKDSEENEKKNKKEHEKFDNAIKDNKKEHEKFDKEIKDNKKDHEKFEKEIEKVNKKADKIDEAVQVDISELFDKMEAATKAIENLVNNQSDGFDYAISNSISVHHRDWGGFSFSYKVSANVRGEPMISKDKVQHALKQILDNVGITNPVYVVYKFREAPYQGGKIAGPADVYFKLSLKEPRDKFDFILNDSTVVEATQGKWYVYDEQTTNIKKKLSTYKGAKTWAEKNGGKVASAEYWNDNIKKEVNEAVIPGGEGSRPGGYPAIINNTATSLHIGAASFMQQQVKKYKKYEAGTDSIPAGPDTTKFSATRSGMIEYAPKTMLRSEDAYCLDFVKIGGLVNRSVREKMVSEFKKWLATTAGDPILSFVTADGYHVRIREADGTNWGGYGLEFDKLSDSSFERYKSTMTRAVTEDTSDLVTKTDVKSILKSLGYATIKAEGANGTSKSLGKSGISLYGMSPMDATSAGTERAKDKVNAIRRALGALTIYRKSTGDGIHAIDVFTFNGETKKEFTLVGSVQRFPTYLHSAGRDSGYQTYYYVLSEKTKSTVNESADAESDVANAVVAEVMKLIGEGHTEVSPDVITTKVSAAIGKPFMLKDLVAANNSSPALQHYIDSINPGKIKFSTDILTVKNEDPLKEKEKAQSGVANMASRAAGRSRLGESKLKTKAKFEELAQKVKVLKDKITAPSLTESASPAERKANRELWDKVNSRGKVPSIDHERYTPMQGLEGPIRLRSGKVVYYDTKAGKYYDRDADMYLSDEDYMAHDAGSVRESTDDHAAYSWRTTKKEDGSYDWSVIKVAYQKPTEVLKSGNEPTRARAGAKAKKAVMVYRRGNVTENLDDAAKEADYNTGHKKGTADKQAGKENNSAECISDRERKGYADGYKSLNEEEEFIPGENTSMQEGWESGPEERSPTVDRSDWDYDQAMQDKLDAKMMAEPKKASYKLNGRGPNMEPNWDFGLDEFDTKDAAKAERDRLMADPSTPNPTMISIQTINRTLKEWGGQATLPLRSKEDYIAKRKALTDIQADPDTARDPMLKNEVVRRLMSLQKQWEEMQEKETALAEDILRLAGLKK